MKIIHTSDWHLGKTLEGYSRLEEQGKFIDELIDIADSLKSDMIIIAGDIFDTGNPPAKAEALFYSALKKLSKGGERAILIIAGNHDSPERLEAVIPIAREQGVIILGTPKSIAPIGEYGGFQITASGEGFVELEIRGERAIIITLPYPSEKRLEEILTEELNEEDRQRSYSEKVGEIFERLSHRFSTTTINIVVSHLFLVGGKTSESERPIQLGGSFAVEKDKLPKNAQYIALGHLHRSQRFENAGVPVVYSGSPIQYSKSEMNNSNCIYSIEVEAGEKALVDSIMLHNYKPIEVWKCSSISQAIKKCSEDGDSNKWVYIEIATNRVLLQEEIKEMKSLRRDIIGIWPEMKGAQDIFTDYESMKEKGMKEVFSEFYFHERNIKPTEEMLDLFLSIAEEVKENEA